MKKLRLRITLSIMLINYFILSNVISMYFFEKSVKLSQLLASVFASAIWTFLYYYYLKKDDNNN